MPSKKSTAKVTRAASSQQKSASKQAWYLQQKVMLPLIMVIVFAAIGTYVIRKSKAATAYPVSMLDPSNRCSTPGVDDLPTPLGQGNAGPCVVALQNGLNNWNSFRAWVTAGRIPYHPLTADGIFGPATKSAVMDFQREHSANGKRLAVDGYVGASTWTALLNDCAVVRSNCGPTGSK